MVGAGHTRMKEVVKDFLCNAALALYVSLTATLFSRLS